MDERLKNLGWGKLIALVILLLVILLIILGKLAGLEAWLFVGLALAILLL